MQDTNLTSDKILNSLIYGEPFWVIIYRIDITELMVMPL